MNVKTVRAAVFEYLVVVFTAGSTATLVVFMHDLLQGIGVDQWGLGFVAGSAGCVLLMGLMKARKSE